MATTIDRLFVPNSSGAVQEYPFTLPANSTLNGLTVTGTLTASNVNITGTITANTANLSVISSTGLTLKKGSYTYSLPNKSGTFALLEDLQIVGGGVKLYRVNFELLQVVSAMGFTFNLFFEVYLPSLVANLSNCVSTVSHFTASSLTQAGLINSFYDTQTSILQSFSGAAWDFAVPATGVITNNSTGEIMLINRVKFMNSGTFNLICSPLSSSPLNSAEIQIVIGSLQSTVAQSFMQINKILDTTASLVTITADDATGDITITTYND